MEFAAFFLRQKSVGRKENQPWPTLTFSSRQLGKSQFAVGKRPETRGIITDSLSGRLCDCRCVSCRGWSDRGNRRHRKFVPRVSRFRADFFPGGEKVSFYTDRGVGVHIDIAGLRRGSNILAEIESGHRNRPF